MIKNLHKPSDTDKEITQSCSTVTYQPATVSVPVSVKPKVFTGDIETFCCGEPIVTPTSCSVYCSNTRGVCNYTITQNICIEIPIEFGAKAYVGSPIVQCGKATGINNCKDCGK